MTDSLFERESWSLHFLVQYEKNRQKTVAHIVGIIGRYSFIMIFLIMLSVIQTMMLVVG